MTYIELINRFWDLDENWQFTCCETRLYFYLLKTANRLGWVDSWTRIDARVAVDVGVSVNSLKTARNRLSQAGLITYVSGGKGKGNKTKYQLSYQNLTAKLTPKVIPKVTPKVEPKVQPKPAYIGTRIDQDKDKEDNSLSPPLTREGELPFDYRVLDKPLDECHRELKSNESWAEQFCMNIRHEFRDFLPEQFPGYLDAYFRKLGCEGVTNKSPSDAQRHFYNWLKVELKNKKNEKRNSPKPSRGSIIPIGTNRTENDSPTTINTPANDLEEFINGLSIGG